MFIQRHPKSGRNLKMEDAAKAEMKDFAYDSLIDASVPIVGQGVKQANRSGTFMYRLLKQFPLCGPMMLFSTPQVRGRQGMEIMLPYLQRAGVSLVPSGQPESPLYQQDLRLGERSFGDWDGMTPKQIENYYSTKAALIEKGHKGKLTRKEIKFLQDEATRPYAMFMNNKNDINTGGFYAKPPNGESPFDVALRLRDFGGTIARQRGDHDVSRFFIETHGEVCKILPITFMKKAPYENYRLEKKPGNTAIRMITGDPDGEGYVDHGYIYDPENDINILKKNHIPNLQKYLY
jgi:broad specificity phosphatase PhoE